MSSLETNYELAQIQKKKRIKEKKKDGGKNQSPREGLDIRRSTRRDEKYIVGQYH